MKNIKLSVLVTNDYAKKEESSGRMRVRPSKGSSRKAEEDSEEEENEKSDEEEYVPESEDNFEEDDESLEGSAASSSEEDREESPRVSPAKSLAGMKRKKEVKKSKNEQRKRTRHDDNNNYEDMEIKHKRKPNPEPMKETKGGKESIDKEKEENSKGKEDTSKETENDKKGGKKETPIFNDRNVDLDLFNSSPNNVVAKKVKVANNLIVTCRNIDQIEGARGSGLSYDFAALTFQRKTANDKMFEFVVPLGLAPAIKNAIDHIIEKNPKFFSGH